jgi:hypothetical protein
VAVLPIVIAEVFVALVLVARGLAAPVLGRAVAGTPGRLAVAVACVIIVARSLPPRLVRLAIAAAPRRSGVAMPFALWIVVPGRLLESLVALVIDIGRPPRLVVFLIGRLDDGVEPLTNRHAGSARGVACSRTCFRTETSQIPRTARSHSDVQAT